MDHKKKYIKYKQKSINCVNKMANRDILFGGAILQPEIIGMLSNWISIQNITIGKNFMKKFLIPLKENEIDKCEQYSPENCNFDPICDIYTNSKREELCVKKDRISQFTRAEKLRKFIGKDEKEYGILESNLMDINFEGYIIDQAYYYFVSPIQTANIIYVLFSDGEVLGENDLYSDKMSSEFEKIHGKIVEYLKTAPDIKFVFTGHSMGSVFACLCGLYIAQINPRIFEKSCYIFGSGGFKWLRPSYDDILRTYSTKIKLFITSIYDEQDGIYYVDKKFYQGSRSLDHFFPIIILTSSKKHAPIVINRNEVVLLRSIDVPKYNKINNLINMIHSWDHYRNSIESLISTETQQISEI